MQILRLIVARISLKFNNSSLYVHHSIFCIKPIQGSSFVANKALKKIMSFVDREWWESPSLWSGKRAGRFIRDDGIFIPYDSMTVSIEIEVWGHQYLLSHSIGLTSEIVVSLDSISDSVSIFFSKIVVGTVSLAIFVQCLIWLFYGFFWYGCIWRDITAMQYRFSLYPLHQEQH